MKMLIFLNIINFSITSVLHAEITLDGTLGSHVTLNGPDYTIGAELGQQLGGNLFHSFEQFDLNTNESATFSGPESVNNIISRVTGGTPSYLDGVLRSVIPEADVYLINPYGLMFGPNARLDVQGSFHASTADTLRLQDGGEFNARNPQDSLLTVAPVSAFGFLTDSPSSLSIEGSQLSTSSGKTLSFFGGNMQIDQTSLSAISGRVNLAAVVDEGDVILQPEDLVLSSIQAGDVVLQNSTVSSEDGGRVYIRAGQLLLDNTYVETNTNDTADAGEISVQTKLLTAINGGRFVSETLGKGRGGKVKVKVEELAEFSGENSAQKYSGISVVSRGEGDGGSVELESGNLTLKEGALIGATALNSGHSGNIYIHSADSITLSGLNSLGRGSSIGADTVGQVENAGNAGVIVLEAGQLNLASGARIGSITIGPGQGGQVNIKVTGQVNLSGQDQLGQTTSIAADTYGSMENAGNGGEIFLEAEQLYISEGAQIATNTIGPSQGGLISIKVADEVGLSGESRILTQSTGSGKGGTLELEANQLIIDEGAKIIASSSGTGQGGTLKIKVNDLVKLEGVNSDGYGSSIAAQTNAKATDAGDGGTIMLIAGRLQLNDGAQIGASTFGSGQGGQVSINVAKDAVLSGQDQSEENFVSGIFTSSESKTDNAGDAGSVELRARHLVLKEGTQIKAGTVVGSGGNVNIQVHNLDLTEGSSITAQSDGEGDAGQVALIIGNLLKMDNSVVKTSADRADGGDLLITAPSYIYLKESQITTSVSEDFGGGGNITLKPEFIVLDGSQIFAKAKKGQGGNINVTTTGIYNFTGESIENVINASSEFGVDGVVTISTPDNNTDEGLIVLPATFFDASALIDTPCSQKMAENLSRFVILEKEGLPSTPDEFLPSGLPSFNSVSFEASTSSVPMREISSEKGIALIGCGQKL